MALSRGKKIGGALGIAGVTTAALILLSIPRQVGSPAAQERLRRELSEHLAEEHAMDTEHAEWGVQTLLHSDQYPSRVGVIFQGTRNVAELAQQKRIIKERLEQFFRDKKLSATAKVELRPFDYPYDESFLSFLAPHEDHLDMIENTRVVRVMTGQAGLEIRVKRPGILPEALQKLFGNRNSPIPEPEIPRAPPKRIPVGTTKARRPKFRGRGSLPRSRI